MQVACSRSLGKVVHCHLHNGLTINIQYYTSDCAFNGFEKLFRKLKIVVNDVIIVSILDASNISLTFYKKNGAELKLTEDFVTQINEDETCPKRRKISEYTATAGEEIFEVVHIKEEIEGTWIFYNLSWLRAIYKMIDKILSIIKFAGLMLSIPQTKIEPNIAQNEDISASMYI